MKQTFYCKSLTDTEKCAQQIAQLLAPSSVIFLNGDMAAGKTTLVRHMVRALGGDKEVTSPTYNLMQSYRTPKAEVYHLDLYRIQQPEEVAFLALEDVDLTSAIIFVEWPQRGRGYLPASTHVIDISVVGEDRVVAFSTEG